MDGILLVNKPKGVSSFGVVAKVRVIWRAQLREAGESPKKAKVGHTGTLDPAASGLMILVLGSYCKRASEFSKLDKTYLTEVTLGKSSSTGDQEGEISVHSDDPKPTAEQVREVLNKFIGQIQQVPPAFSAIKINGQRAYDLARKGEKPELKPRQVTIYNLQLTDYAYPVIKLTAKVSSGTYIRSLAEDIGKALGGHAYMSELQRTEVDSYSIDDAVKLENINLEQIQNHLLTGVEHR